MVEISHLNILKEQPFHRKKKVGMVHCLSSTCGETPFLWGYSWWEHIPGCHNPIHFITGRGWTWLLVSARWCHMPYFKWNNVILQRFSGSFLISKDLCPYKSPWFSFSQFLPLELLKRSGWSIGTTHTHTGWIKKQYWV